MMASETTNNILKCTPFCSCIHYTFWPKLWELKLNIDKLDEHGRDVLGYYSDFNKIPSLEVEFSSFKIDELQPTGPRMYPAKGICLTKNTIESFKQCDRTKLLNDYGCLLKEKLLSTVALDDPSHLATFLIIIFANLKSYHFHYWFAFLTPSDVEIQSVTPSQPLEKVISKELVTELNEKHLKLPLKHRGFFAVELSNNHLIVYTLKEFADKYGSGEAPAETVCHFVMVDPSPLVQYPGWTIRNFGILIKHHFPSLSRKSISVIRLRGTGSTSSIINIQLANCSLEKWMGWERNERGKYAPMFADLSGMMDPSKLAEQGVELNLRLMKWRLAPQLDLETIKHTRCLLLGAGTLGCSVARNLLAWGVQNITFVDNGHVSHSNPVRQSLYVLDDCSGKSKSKAVVAAEALVKIHPKVNAVGVVMDIPMPGHSTSDKGTCDKLSENQVESEYIADLIDQHDVIFLLTDSRESRWLPTLIAAAKRKLAITAALGFDTYLVMRHGIREEEAGDTKPLGCYFCNDVTAPGNSMRDRTLDQQCTVTRPGVSGIAASLAVELVVSVLQHPQRGKACCKEETILGGVPHSIRGFLYNNTQMLPATPAFDCCIACSTKVINEYEEHKREFLSKVYESTSYLEQVSGLSQLLTAQEIENVLILDSEEEED